MSSKGTKPDKPYPDFPLFPHATRRWAKKIRGKLYYFGPWEDPEAALQTYLDHRDDLYAGRKPRLKDDSFRLRDVCNRYLTYKQLQLKNGEIRPRTFADCHRTCKTLIEVFRKERSVADLDSEDFERLRFVLAKSRGATALADQINRIRGVFKYAYDAGLIDKPMRYAPGFRRPAKHLLRQQRTAKGPCMFEANQIGAMLEAAGPQMKAMILLGINCGFGNSDCGNLPLSALDLRGGWIDYPRPKTAVARRCALWADTVKALRDAIENRPQPRNEEDAGLVFLTRNRTRWAKEPTVSKLHSEDKESDATKSDLQDSVAIQNPLSAEFRKLLDRVGMYRKGIGFYALRHTFETVAGESRDQVAVDHIMGHARDDMASVYRERISDERLIAVTKFVHDWLFGKPGS